VIDRRITQRVALIATRPGPAISPDEAAKTVADLRAASRRAVGLVADVTGLTEAAERAAAAPVFVIDRPAFIRANVQMLDEMMGDIPEVAILPGERRSTSTGAGLALAVMASRVLGQFDPFIGLSDDDVPSFPPHPTATPSRGRLLLVAPNVVDIERGMNVKPSDFRLWVGLHEMTHAVQFAAAPWLGDHLSDLCRQLAIEESAPGEAQDMVRLVRAVVRTIRGESGANLATEAMPDSARAVMEQVTAVMSLLEGHADVVMDAVGPQVIPTLATIRARFEARRRGRSSLDRLIRRLAGLDAKRDQYVGGAAFVRGVLEVVGHEGLAQAFVSKENLPTVAEIADPLAWATRVIG
jgi:coenzyme F420 biosynthesis associated uncharacterized protein